MSNPSSKWQGQQSTNIATQSCRLQLEWMDAFLQSDAFRHLAGTFQKEKWSSKERWNQVVIEAFQKDPNYLKLRFLDLFTPGSLQDFQAQLLKCCENLHEK